jgi:hypothetical protein
MFDTASNGTVPHLQGVTGNLDGARQAPFELRLSLHGLTLMYAVIVH